MIKWYELAILGFLLTCCSIPGVAALLMFSRSPLIDIAPTAYEIPDVLTPSVYSDDEVDAQYQALLQGEWVETAGPILSPPHWGYVIRTTMSHEMDVYVQNYENVLLEMELRELGEDVDVEYIPYQPGTILLKSHFADMKTLNPFKVTFMIKEKKHYDMQYDNWRYVMYDNGVKVLDGNSHSKAVYKQCIDCHQSVRNRGFAYNNYLHDHLQLNLGDQ